MSQRNDTAKCRDGFDLDEYDQLLMYLSNSRAWEWNFEVGFSLS